MQGYELWEFALTFQLPQMEKIYNLDEWLQASFFFFWYVKLVLKTN